MSYYIMRSRFASPRAAGAPARRAAPATGGWKSACPFCRSRGRPGSAAKRAHRESATFRAVTRSEESTGPRIQSLEFGGNQFAPGNSTPYN